MSNFWEKLPKPFLVLAPMEDVTDVVFREIVAKLAKPDVFFTEFTNAQGLNSKGRDAIIHRFKFTQNQHPIVAQIWGTKPEAMFEAAKLVKELGFDGVDINMGCTDKAVVKKGCGAGLIGNYDLAGEIISAVKKGAGSLQVSVKTRLGTDDWFTFLLKQHLNALTIHARYPQQFLQGEANWGQIGKIVELKNRISPRTIIIGNGDIKNYQQALEMNKTYKVDGVMIGRGIFSNPWVFEKSTNPRTHGKDEYLQILLNHLISFNKVWGDRKNFDSIKKFYKMYVKDFSGAFNLRKKLMDCRNYSETIKVVKENLTGES